MELLLSEEAIHSLAFLLHKGLPYKKKNAPLELFHDVVIWVFDMVKKQQALV